MNGMSDSAMLFFTLVASSGLKAALLLWLGDRKRKEYVGIVSELYVYPLKSGRELKNLKRVVLTKYGFVSRGLSDRHWLVTKSGDMVTMKSNSRLTLITPMQLDDHTLRLDAPKMEPLILKLNPNMKPKRIVKVIVKNTPILALDCGEKASLWVCKVLREDGLRLNYSASSLPKRQSCKVKKDWQTLVQPNDEVAFQDFVQCMIMCESSLEYLNKRLDKPMTIIPFRPNIVISGTIPFDEDNWKEVFIGSRARVRFVDKCTRCAITTMDPQTGIKDKDEQPLKELRSFRCMPPYGPKPCMGIYTAVDLEGEIKVGDPVYAVRKLKHQP